MENLFIEATNYTPQIDFQGKIGVFNISGDCYHEYTTEFFRPIFEWLKKYTNDAGKKIVVNFKLEYFNTSASRRFQEMIDILEEYQLKKKGQIVINWYYDKNSPDNLEAGEEYAKFAKVKFNLLPL
ncbi:MAG: DUF1987 domain-containing protein [Microscillaceae bacterium]|jgi:hypothetical protein|nr:DUF1987 domain-containing protein [Microscillaceae bacterium]